MDKTDFLLVSFPTLGIAFEVFQTDRFNCYRLGSNRSSSLRKLRCLKVFLAQQHGHSSMTMKLRYPTIEERKSLPEEMRNVGQASLKKGKLGHEFPYFCRRDPFRLRLS
jgi:hypothetical protein